MGREEVLERETAKSKALKGERLGLRNRVDALHLEMPVDTEKLSYNNLSE